MMKKNLSDKLAEIDARLIADTSLSNEERDTIRERARQHVAKLQHDKAVDAYFEQAVREERAKHVPAEQLEDIAIDLPEHAAMIRLDSVMYFHGLVYTVPYPVARTMADIMARAWEHQSEIDGQPRRGDLAQKPRHITIGPQHANVNVRSQFTTGARG